MNLKIAFATAIILTSGTVATQAQQSNAVTQAATTISKAAFNKKIAAFQKETDLTKSLIALRDMQTDMRTGLSSIKMSIKESSASAKPELMKKEDTRLNSFNETVTLARTTPIDKVAMVSSLKKYSETL